MSAIKSRMHDLLVLTGLLAGSLTLFSTTVDKTYHNHNPKSNRQTQLNHIVDVILTTSYLDREEQFIVNAAEGYEIISYHVVFDPKAGEARFTKAKSTALPSWVSTALRSAEPGDHLILDQVMAVHNGDTSRLMPAMYRIVAD